MSIKEKEEEIINTFSMYDEWLDKYQYLIDLGNDLPQINEALKTKEHLISGCQSQVWVEAQEENGKMHFFADSDAIITKGLIGILIGVVEGEEPKDVAHYDFGFVKAIGLQEHLSPTRSNGLLSMVKYIKMRALEMMK